MKEIKFVNNSVSGVYRAYADPHLELEIPGSGSVTLSVPKVLLQDVIDYLKERHPAIEIHDLTEADATAPAVDSTVAEPPVATGNDESAGASTEQTVTEPASETVATDENAAMEQPFVAETETAVVADENPVEATVEAAPTQAKNKGRGGKKA